MSEAVQLSLPALSHLCQYSHTLITLSPLSLSLTDLLSLPHLSPPRCDSNTYLLRYLLSALQLHSKKATGKEQ